MDNTSSEDKQHLKRKDLDSSGEEAKRLKNTHSLSSQTTSTTSTTTTTTSTIPTITTTSTTSTGSNSSNSSTSRSDKDDKEASSLLVGNSIRNCFVFIGPPGAGKGSVAARLIEKNSEKGEKYVQISTGELLRQERERDTEKGKFIRGNWNYALLVDLTFELLEAELANTSGDILLDGCKTDKDAKRLAEILKQHNIKLAGAIEFKVTNDKLLQERISGRLIHASGRIYHEKFNPPKATDVDDVTGEQLVKRHDDGEAVVLKRIAKFRQESEDILKYYRKLGLLQRLNAEQELDAVFRDLEAIIASCRSGDLKKNSAASVGNDESEHGTDNISDFVEQVSTKMEGKEEEDTSKMVLKLAAAKLARFPGAHPTALTRENMMEALSSPKYYVSVKSDGIRYLVLIMDSFVYLVNRKMEIFKIKGKLGGRPCSDTLLDAEVVQDIPSPQHPVSAASKQAHSVPTFTLMVFDALCVNGRNVKSLMIPQRIKEASKCVGYSDVRGTLPFSKIEVTKYTHVSQISAVLDDIPKLSHKTDGLIFVGAYYKLGYDTSLLKWKPASLNTADFWLHIPDADAAHYQLFCTDSTEKPPESDAPEKSGGAVFADWIRASKELVELGDGSIIECYWEKYTEEQKQTYAPRVGEWRYMRTRTDKPTPNAAWVVKKIMDSLDSDILDSELRALSKQVSSLPGSKK